MSAWSILESYPEDSGTLPGETQLQFLKLLEGKLKYIDGDETPTDRNAVIRREAFLETINTAALTALETASAALAGLEGSVSIRQAIDRRTSNLASGPTGWAAIVRWLLVLRTVPCGASQRLSSLPAIAADAEILRGRIKAAERSGTKPKRDAVLKLRQKQHAEHRLLTSMSDRGIAAFHAAMSHAHALGEDSASILAFGPLTVRSARSRWSLFAHCCGVLAAAMKEATRALTSCAALGVESAVRQQSSLARWTEACATLQLIEHWTVALDRPQALRHCDVCYRRRRTRKRCAVHKSSTTVPPGTRAASLIAPQFLQRLSNLTQWVSEEPVWVDPGEHLLRAHLAMISSPSAEEPVRVDRLATVLRSQLEVMRPVIGEKVHARMTALREFMVARLRIPSPQPTTSGPPALDELTLNGLLRHWFRGIDRPPKQLAWLRGGIDPGHPLSLGRAEDPVNVMKDLLLFRAWLDVEQSLPDARRRIDAADVRQRVERGESYRSIARALGVSVQGVINAHRRTTAH